MLINANVSPLNVHSTPIKAHCVKEQMRMIVMKYGYKLQNCTGVDWRLAVKQGPFQGNTCQECAFLNNSPCGKKHRHTHTHTHTHTYTHTHALTQIHFLYLYLLLLADLTLTKVCILEPSATPWKLSHMAYRHCWSHEICSHEDMVQVVFIHHCTACIQGYSFRGRKSVYILTQMTAHNNNNNTTL